MLDDLSNQKNQVYVKSTLLAVGCGFTVLAQLILADSHTGSLNARKSLHLARAVLDPVWKPRCTAQVMFFSTALCRPRWAAP